MSGDLYTSGSIQVRSSNGSENSQPVPMGPMILPYAPIVTSTMFYREYCKVYGIAQPGSWAYFHQAGYFKYADKTTDNGTFVGYLGIFNGPPYEMMITTDDRSLESDYIQIPVPEIYPSFRAYVTLNQKALSRFLQVMNANPDDVVEVIDIGNSTVLPPDNRTMTIPYLELMYLIINDANTGSIYNPPLIIINYPHTIIVGQPFTATITFSAEVPLGSKISLDWTDRLYDPIIFDYNGAPVIITYDINPGIGTWEFTTHLTGQGITNNTSILNVINYDTSANIFFNWNSDVQVITIYIIEGPSNTDTLIQSTLTSVQTLTDTLTSNVPLEDITGLDYLSDPNYPTGIFTTSSLDTFNASLVAAITQIVPAGQTIISITLELIVTFAQGTTPLNYTRTLDDLYLQI